MEKAVFRYSDFFEDDGGFDTIRRDFNKLGDDLVKKAKEVREQTKLFDVDQVDMIKEVEQQTESLVKAFKKYEGAKVDLEKVEKAVTEAQKRQNQTQDDQIETLVKLDKRLRQYRSDLSEANKLIKNGTDNGKDLNKQRVEAQLNIKNVSKEIRGQQQEILKANDLSKKEEKLTEARLILQKEEIRNREDLRERIKALRIVVDSLDFVKEADEIKAFNDEIDELTRTLGDNSDKFIQSKINIGNYEESIVNALSNTSFFSGELAILNKGVDLLIGSLIKNTKTTKKSEEATEKNTKAIKLDTKAKKENKKATEALKEEVNDTGKAVNGFSKILKASGILILLTIIASIGSAFSQGRKGVILTEKAMARFNVTIKVLTNTLGDLGSGLFDIFSGIATNLSSLFLSAQKFALEAKLQILELTGALTDNSQAIQETQNKIKEIEGTIEENKKNNDKFAEGWDKITAAIGRFRERYDDAVKAIETNDQGIINAFRIADEIRKAELGLIALRKQVQLLELRSEDSTVSLRQQLQLTDELLEKRIELLEKESDIALKNLSLANAQARVDAESAGFRLSADDVEFARQLLALNQSLDPTENPLSDEFLEESQQALRVYLESLSEVQISEEEIGRQRREISRDLFEQNLDLLIDLIDVEKNLSEQFVNDVTKNFKSRIDELNRFIIVFRTNTQKQLNEFNDLASENAKTIKAQLDKVKPSEENKSLIDFLTTNLEKLENIDLSIEYDENGDFKVFNGDVEFALKDIVKLNEQLQSLGLAEIPINRFREFVTETGNGVRDFRDLNKELKLVGINVGELRENISVSRDELNALDNLEKRIAALAVASRGNLSTSERNKILQEIEKLENEKTAIEEFAEFQRLNNRKDAIDEELKTVEEESERYLELIQERLDIEKELRDKSASDILERVKKNNQKEIDEQKKLGEEVREILDAVLDRALEAQQERVDGAEERVDRQNELVDIQRERAQEGLSNTLAFEQRELAKREAERIRQEARQRRLEQIRSLYSAYNNYASRGEENPLVNALRDFSILQAIEASLGDGGVVEDRIAEKNGGIIRGRSHQGRNGGIPVLVEGKEGVLSSREMDNLGKDNFYKMKDLASMGKVDSNFFSRQRKSFVKQIPVSGSYSPELVQEMKEVKKAIQGKPVQQWDAYSVVDGTLELVETMIKKNKVSRNHYKVKRKKL